MARFGSGRFGSARFGATAQVPRPSKGPYQVQLTAPDGTTRTIDRVLDPGIVLEHSAHHSCSVVAKKSAVSADDAFSKISVSAGGDTLFVGEVERVRLDQPRDGEATLQGRGPLLPLRRSAPTQTPAFDAVPVDTVLEEFASEAAGTSISLSATRPEPTIKADDVATHDTAVEPVSDFVSVPPEQPVVVGADLEPARTALLKVEDDFVTAGADIVAAANQPYNVISGEAAVLSGSALLTATFIPDHTIPADSVGIAIHGPVTDTDDVDPDNVTIKFNNLQDLGALFGLPGWQDTTSQYQDPQFQDPGEKLQAGQAYDFTIDVDIGSNEYVIDAIVVYDQRYPPSGFDSPDSNGQIAAPERYPPAVSVETDPVTRPYCIRGADVSATLTDTSGGQALGLTVGDETATASNSASVSIDARGRDAYATSVTGSITVGGHGSGPIIQQRANPQVVEDYTLSVTTDDLPLFSGTLDAPTDYRNLQRVIEDTPFVFVADPTTRSPPTIKAFRRGDPQLQRSVNRRVLDARRQRSVRGYANEVAVQFTRAEDGTEDRFTARDEDEVAAVGRVIPAPPIRTGETLTQDEARIRATNELGKRTARDTAGGDLETSVGLIRPGYPYAPAELGGHPITLERTRFRRGREEARADLQFRRDDDLTAQVAINVSDIERTRRQL